MTEGRSSGDRRFDWRRGRIDGFDDRLIVRGCGGKGGASLGQTLAPDAAGGGVKAPCGVGWDEEQLCLDHENSMNMGCDRILSWENVALVGGYATPRW